MNNDTPNDHLTPASEEHLIAQVATEKISYMHTFAKSSTMATIVAPLLCIPLYGTEPIGQSFHIWLALMAVAVAVRIYLIQSIRLDDSVRTNFNKLNWAVGLVTFVWGIGWLMLVPNMEWVNYLLYQIISLTVLYVGMVGYCVNWKTFYSFALPLKVPELLFIMMNFQLTIWPIAIGSMVTFYLALRMGLLFANSWEKSISLRYRNEQLFAELTREKDASVTANIAKSAFIATASHDLRQPMQAINIFIELVNFKNLGERERSIFQKMRASITVLNKMFNTLLDISKLDSNLTTFYEDFELAAVVNDIALTFTPSAVEKNISLQFNESNYLVYGDRNLTEQILRNLLANAIQYTSTGGVTVDFTDVNGRLTISVKDTGCGIPQEDLPFIYKEFFRSQHSRSQHDGLGLGLSIVSRIIEKLGGQLSVDTQPLVGTQFKADTRFPIKRVKHGTAIQPLRSATVQPELWPQHVVVKHLGILENDTSLMNAYVSFFVSMGYKVHCLPHTETEFKNSLLSIPHLDFILSDYRLGDHDGVYFIETLREEFNENIPACIVTADTSPQHLSMFKALQIEVLYKPIDIHSISDFIASRLR
jgi:signal transduction histidine kinase